MRRAGRRSRGWRPGAVPRLGLVVVTLVASACADNAETAGIPSAPVEVGTIALGGLPEDLSDDTVPALPPEVTDPSDPDNSVAATVPPTTDGELSLEPGSKPLQRGQAGKLVDGNRVLLIGDSIVASTAPRFGGVMCAVLNQFGWTAEIDAQTGKFIDYGSDVLDDRLAGPDADWDAAVLMLGNNFRGDYDAFTVAYDDLLDRLAPRPTIIYTLTETDAVHAKINVFLRWRPYFHPNVYVVDWAQLTAAEPDKLLGNDGLHLTTEGRGRLALFTVDALGKAPSVPGEPECTDNAT